MNLLKLFLQNYKGAFMYTREDAINREFGVEAKGKDYFFWPYKIEKLKDELIVYTIEERGRVESDSIDDGWVWLEPVHVSKVPENVRQTFIQAIFTKL